MGNIGHGITLYSILIIRMDNLHAGGHSDRATLSPNTPIITTPMVPNGVVERDQILDPLKIKYHISDPQKNQISAISRSQKSDIWLKKIRYQISDPQKKSNISYLALTKIRYLAKKNQISDIRPPKTSNIRYHTP